MTSHLDRRTVLRSGALAVGVGAAATTLAACGSTGTTSGGSGGTTAGAGGASPTSGGQAGLTVAATDVPVGGGTIVKGQVVVTQPSAGQFKAFSAVCTHQGCTVDKVANGEIDCPCHGSAFAITDGAVLRGPATAPLPARTVTDSGGTLTVT